MRPAAALLRGPCRHQDSRHSLLAFSFSSAHRTDVLRVTGDSYSQELLAPGLEHAAASLLLTRMPGDWLLQATSQQLRVVAPQGSQLACCWQAPGEQGRGGLAAAQRRCRLQLPPAAASCRCCLPPPLPLPCGCTGLQLSSGLRLLQRA